MRSEAGGRHGIWGFPWRPPPVGWLRLERAEPRRPGIRGYPIPARPL
ncbi:Uncharacterised protein [Amycolatopsis camponoti]|uniref:Uncharacterized protein n=1 Tax=Amycolatopsis camponoti TaxID=2606593 RepID=A0A6I8LJG6_9PSEU|nr:hypothetical protein [Amycolatopsis camponoti]VVJ15429.1 Uncharacterised protein [Amycolatopsis camponoti]